MEINYLAIVSAAFASFLLGGLWYSPLLFGKTWQREVGLSDEQVRSGNKALIFGGTFALNLIAAGVFAAFLGPNPALRLALGAGFAAGLGWVTTSFGVNYLFERKSWALFLINGGYNTLMFTLFGLVLGEWH